MSNVEKEKKLIRLGIDLNEEASQEFLAIKKNMGIESNADVVRWLIRDRYAKITTRSE